MPRAFILGGTGLVGRAAARCLTASGCKVDMVGCDPERVPADMVSAGTRFIAADYGDKDQLYDVFGAGADLLVDCICYTADDATRVLPLAKDTAPSR